MLAMFLDANSPRDRTHEQRVRSEIECYSLGSATLFYDGANDHDPVSKLDPVKKTRARNYFDFELSIASLSSAAESRSTS
jgi:hypothetical protein